MDFAPAISMLLRHKHNVRGFILVKKLIVLCLLSVSMCDVLVTVLDRRGVPPAGTEMLTPEQLNGSLWLGERLQ